MTFQELPTSKKVLFMAHSLTALSAFIIAVSNLIALAEQDALPIEGMRSSPNTDSMARSYFK